MNERKTLSETSLTSKPLQSDRTTTLSFERDLITTKSHSHTTGQDNVSKPPPTAMVAPLVGTITTNCSLSNNPRYGGHKYKTEGTLSTPSLDRLHDKASLRDMLLSSPSKSANGQIQSLMNSLSERSLIIERQKLTISRLQQECRDKDAQLRNLYSTELSSAHGNHLLTDPNNTAVSAPVKIDMLSRKLDSLYYELDKKKEEVETTSGKLKAEKLSSSELSAQLDKSRSRTKELEEKIEKLQGYLGNMPTMDEHYSLKEDVTSLTNQYNQLMKQVKTSNESINNLKDTIKSKEEELERNLSEMMEIKKRNHDLELKCHSLNNSILQLQSENSQLKQDNQQTQDSVSTFDKRLHTELSSMRERHHVRFRDATAKLREQHKEVMKRNKLLEKQLLKSSDAMTELNTELNHKQGMVGQLKTSLDSLLGENQSLLHQNLVLQASHVEAIRSTQSSPADNEFTHKLLREISICVDDFESLINLISSMINGQDPNSSLLLGVNKIESTPLNSDDMDIQKQLEHVIKQRGEIERLRIVITDRYADQIANDCTVQ